MTHSFVLGPHREGSYSEVFSLFFLCTVGYAWLPLMKHDQIASQEYNIPIATSLPPNYLSVQDSASGKVSSDV